MKHTLKIIAYPILWMLYFLIVFPAKWTDYQRGKMEGKHVDSAKTDYFGHTTYKYNPTKEPEKEYLTIREFHKSYWNKNFF